MIQLIPINTLYQLGKSGVNYDNDVFKLVLCTNVLTFDITAHEKYADISAYEVANGNGYTTGGLTLTKSGVFLEDNVNSEASQSFVDLLASITSSITFKNVLIINNSHTDKIIMCCYVFGADQIVPVGTVKFKGIKQTLKHSSTLGQNEPVADWLGLWSKRVKITIDSRQIDTPLSNFPCPIKLDAGTLASLQAENTQFSDRKKISFTTADGLTELYAEIVDWSTGAFIVNIPAISDSIDTDIYLYYGVGQLDNISYIGDAGETVAKSVYDSSYTNVWNMQQDPSFFLPPQMINSKGTINGTIEGSMTPTDSVEGKFGHAIDLDGSDDAIQVNGFRITGTVATFEFLVSKNNNFGTQYLLDIDSNRSIIAWGATTTNYISWYDGSFKEFGWVSPTDWHFISIVLNGTSAICYVDGTQLGPPKTITFLSISGASEANIGKHYTAGISAWAGKVNTFWASPAVRSAAWHKALYNGFFGTLLTFGKEE